MLVDGAKFCSSLFTSNLNSHINHAYMRNRNMRFSHFAELF